MFICFDIAFSHPAVDLLNEGVTHFLYSAAIGKIGKMTAAKLWSLIHSATMLLANQGDDSSDIIIKGGQQTHSTRLTNSTLRDFFGSPCVCFFLSSDRFIGIDSQDTGAEHERFNRHRKHSFIIHRILHACMPAGPVCVFFRSC